MLTINIIHFSLCIGLRIFRSKGGIEATSDPTING